MLFAEVNISQMILYLEIAGEDVALVPLTSPPPPTRSTGRGWREDARRVPPSRDATEHTIRLSV